MKVDSRAVSAYQSSASLGAARAHHAKGAKGTSAAKAPERASESAASKKDANVTFSAEARQLAAGGDPGVDHAKVAALKEKVANGSLTVDSHAVAQGIVDRTG